MGQLTSIARALAWLAVAAAVDLAAAQPAPLTCDVCVVGGGSGGFGAALAAARAGAKVFLVEKQPALGGTSTSALVTNWEPGPGCSFARELYRRLKTVPGAVAIAPRMHSYTKSEPYGLTYGRPGTAFTYDHTLRRAGVPRKERCSVVMKPEALAATMGAMLKAAGVRVLLETTFTKVRAGDGVVREIDALAADGRRIVIRAKVFVDSTGGAHLCRAVGCETMLGAEPRSRFNEPAAPEKASPFLNAISLCYRIRKSAAPKRQPAPAGPVGRFGKTAFVSGVDETELIVNPLPLVPGRVLIDSGYAKTMALTRRRAEAHWHWLQQYPHFRGYELKDIAPMLGIRESYRVVTEYILTERDLRAGLAGQKHADIIATADHPLDTHGGGTGVRELKGPYGIPYRCLIPKGWTNLLVACRGAGFTHVAASSCRLSRTMMALGHAAGLAAAEAARTQKSIRDIDVQRLVKAMGAGASAPAANARPAPMRSKTGKRGKRQ